MTTDPRLTVGQGVIDLLCFILFFIMFSCRHILELVLESDEILPLIKTEPKFWCENLFFVLKKVFKVLELKKVYNKRVNNAGLNIIGETRPLLGLLGAGLDLSPISSFAKPLSD